MPGTNRMIIGLQHWNCLFSVRLDTSHVAYLSTGDNPSPLAILTGHEQPVVCVDVNASLGLVVSGSQGVFSSSKLMVEERLIVSKETVRGCVGGSNEIIWIYQQSRNGKLATETITKADVSSVSPSSERIEEQWVVCAFKGRKWNYVIGGNKATGKNKNKLVE